MKIADQKKRIKDAVKRLNNLEHKLRFVFEEEDYCVSVTCHSKDGRYTYGSFTCIEFFDDYQKEEGAYNTVREFAEVMAAAARLTDPKAYHNMI